MSTSLSTYLEKRAAKRIYRRAMLRGKPMRWSRARKLGRAVAYVPLAVERAGKRIDGGKMVARLRSVDADQHAKNIAKLAQENARNAKRGSTMRARRSG